MNMYDVFYDIKQLKLSGRMALLNDANMLATNVFVDKLDVKTSYSRQRTNLTYNDIMLKFDKKCHMVVIHRNNNFINGNVGEIGFCTLAKDIDYFLFMYLPIDKLEIIINKYNLKPMV